MALTTRGRVLTALLVVFVVVAGIVAAVLASAGSKNPLAAGSPSTGASSSPTPPPPPPVCPLTGVNPKGSVPSRPALAVKVENLPSARPQTGLSWADIIYEEPVEAGITRFIVVYQCADASRIEPVRSARLTDADILVQFGRPVFGYAGAVGKVIARVRQRGLIDVNYLRAPGAYHRDPARPQPHNLYTSTRELYAAAHTRGPAPPAVFTYSSDVPAGGRSVSQVHVPFSTSSDVFWKWDGGKKVWRRYYGTVPAVLSDGTQIMARNVVVQVVKTVMTDITDVNGVPSPFVVSVGSGRAYIFRNGRMIVGKWTRPSLKDVTKFEDANGNEIPLTPGNTWVELLPVPRKIKVK
jgi:hypothetical protein